MFVMHSINISFCKGKIFAILNQYFMIMVKSNPYFTASVASLAYFVIFIGLKYLSENKHVDVKGALIGSGIFWIVIFVVHHFLNRQSEI